MIGSAAKRIGHLAIVAIQRPVPWPANTQRQR